MINRFWKWLTGLFKRDPVPDRVYIGVDFASPQGERTHVIIEQRADDPMTIHLDDSFRKVFGRASGFGVPLRYDEVNRARKRRIKKGRGLL